MLFVSGENRKAGGALLMGTRGPEPWVLTVNDSIDKKINATWQDVVNKKHGADTGQTVHFRHKRKKLKSFSL